MPATSFDAAIAFSHEALRAMARGNSTPSNSQWSRRSGATLANPLGPPIVGWELITRESDRVAAMSPGAGEFSFDEVSRVATADLGYLLGIERIAMQRDGSEPVTIALRVTTVFRREDDGWFLVHRHADRVSS